MNNKLYTTKNRFIRGLMKFDPSRNSNRFYFPAMNNNIQIFRIYRHSITD